MITARHENARTLAAALGLAEEAAVERLDAFVLLTVAPGEGRLATRVRDLLRRTLANVDLEAAGRVPAVEVVVGRARRRTSARVVGVGVRDYDIEIREGEVTAAAAPCAHPVVEVLAACYAAAAVVHLSVQAADIPLRLPIEMDVAEILGADVGCLHRPVDLGVAYMAGAGAIGNGLLLGLSTMDVRGELHVCDPDSVSDGNLNRCVWFTADDVGALKAERLVAVAQPHLPRLQLVPHTCVLKKVPAARDGGAWLEKLIVAVDSRRARRSLQTELPHRVFDASTTGIREVVLHFNRLPAERACLSCIYHETRDEAAHERHVAESLGVSLAEVQSGFVTDVAARAIVRLYPNLVPEMLIGLAYDSLFKQLCGQGALKTDADRQVLAPFAFVSTLAGVLLAVELARRAGDRATESPFNYWRLSPWARPSERTRETRPRRAACEFCDDTILQGVVRGLWGGEKS